MRTVTIVAKPNGETGGISMPMLIGDPILMYELDVPFVLRPHERAIPTLLHTVLLGDEDICSADHSFSFGWRMACEAALINSQSLQFVSLLERHRTMIGDYLGRWFMKCGKLSSEARMKHEP